METLVLMVPSQIVPKPRVVEAVVGQAIGKGFFQGQVLLDLNLDEFSNPNSVQVYTRKFQIISNQMCLKIRIIVNVHMYEIIMIFFIYASRVPCIHSSEDGSSCLS